MPDSKTSINNAISYDCVKNILSELDTDDTIAKAHGILCGFACVKPELSLQDWLAEILPNLSDDQPLEPSLSVELAQIYNHTLLQLNDATLDFQPLIAHENYALSQQAQTLIQWCQGFLLGLGLCKINVSDEAVLEMIKDLSAISELDTEVLDSEQNAQDLNEIIEFVRIGVLLIQETLQPSKQDYVSTETLNK